MILIDTLAIEHGLINQMISLMRKELESMEQTRMVRISSIGVLIDFMSTYANRCHCGKEENILLKKLLSKDIASEHQKILRTFTKEHEYASLIIKQLQKARDAYLHSAKNAFDTIRECLQKLVDFYPRHMAREEELFSLYSLQYLDDEEQEDMLEEFWDYDKKLIKEKYRLKNAAKNGSHKSSKSSAPLKPSQPLRAYC
ncbi:MAG: hemerythrin domain-containing protein [Chitinivibrionales bacterium]